MAAGRENGSAAETADAITKMRRPMLHSEHIPRWESKRDFNTRADRSLSRANEDVHLVIGILPPGLNKAGYEDIVLCSLSGQQICGYTSVQERS